MDCPEPGWHCSINQLLGTECILVKRRRACLGLLSAIPISNALCLEGRLCFGGREWPILRRVTYGLECTSISSRGSMDSPVLPTVRFISRDYCCAIRSAFFVTGYSCYEPVLKFITYFGIRCSVQVSDPSGGCPGLSRQLKAESELLRNPINPTNSYGSCEVLYRINWHRAPRSCTPFIHTAI